VILKQEIKPIRGNRLTVLQQLQSNIAVSIFAVAYFLSIFAKRRFNISSILAKMKEYQVFISPINRIDTLVLALMCSPHYKGTVTISTNFQKIMWIVFFCYLFSFHCHHNALLK
jgi:hypothetical protein